MTKAVAVDGDTQVKTSTKKLSADTNNTGSWALVTSSVTKGQKCSVSGKFVELGATAAWSYSGGSVTAGAVTTTLPPVPDSATLVAGTTLLKDNGSNILVDGDEQDGSADADNKIVVTASQQKLLTG
jgi:hypothetical protein